AVAEDDAGPGAVHRRALVDTPPDWAAKPGRSTLPRLDRHCQGDLQGAVVGAGRLPEPQRGKPGVLALAALVREELGDRVVRAPERPAHAGQVGALALLEKAVARLQDAPLLAVERGVLDPEHLANVAGQVVLVDALVAQPAVLLRRGGELLVRQVNDLLQ